MKGYKAVCGIVILVTCGIFVLDRSPSPAQEAKKPDEAAVERTRQTAKMLDDLYKNYVVQITATYVDAQENTPAAHVTKKVFKAMADKGWHKGRLVDATGQPKRQANLPETAFEKQAIAAIKKGTPYVEEVGRDGQTPVLRVATVVPAVLQQCTTCHAGTKQGDVLGALVYEIPIK